MKASLKATSAGTLWLALFVFLACFAMPNGVALAQESPRLSEDEARHVAAGTSEISRILDRHHQLDAFVNYNAADDTWDVSWRNPFNSRRLISVRIDDDTGRILRRTIDAEAYMDILPSLSEETAIEIAREQEPVAREIAAIEDPRPTADLDNGEWTVSFFDDSGEVARVLIDDISGGVNETMAGPQVAWQMARGYDGAFGRVINEPYVWLPLCLVFLLPFFDIRRPWRLFNLDLLVLLSFTVSHYYFNQGDIFTSVPLAYPPLAWLFLRLAWVWLRPERRRAAAAAPEPLVADEPEPPGPRLNFSPRVMLAGLVLILLFRIVINVADSNVVDVGYSGVAGGHQILQGETPYGNMPDDNENGDTYGPLNYLIYAPLVKLMPWSGEWDNLYAAHAAAIIFDLAAVAGMYFAGRRLARSRQRAHHLGVALAFAWAAYPYTTFVLNCNVNDSIVAAVIIWAFVAIASSPLAGLLLGLATQIKFFPALLAPLWASLPDAWRGWGRRTLFVAAFALAVAVAAPVIFLGDGNLSLFWERSLKWQLGRESPFSIWGQHPETLAGAQRIAQYFLIALALVSYILPRKKTMMKVAAASAALLTGFEIVQTHWFYLYIPWFFPLAFIALLMDSARKVNRTGTDVAG